MSEPIITKEDKKKKNKNFNQNSNDTEEFEPDDDDEIVHDFPSMFLGLFKSVPWKLSIYMFILLIALFSKQFIEHVLFPLGKNRFVDGDQPTNVGTIILCLIASLGLIILDLFIKCGIL